MGRTSTGMNFSTEEMLHLCELYQQHGCLYDSTRADYLNRTTRIHALIEIGNILDKTRK